MKHNEEYTNPALLAGLWVFILMQAILQAYSAEELEKMQNLANKCLS